MSAVIIFIIILGLLIFVHEAGHFFVAKRNGIKAEEFGFGFPPRIAGIYKNAKTGKYKMLSGNKNIKTKNTIYSINWIPLGGFVKIKGENGEGKKESDSFASKSAWKRSKVLAAGVVMNFVFAWFLILIVFLLGVPQTIDPGKAGGPGSKIQITQVALDSPAKAANLETGDEILKSQTDLSGKKVSLKSTQDFIDYINSQKGNEITLGVKRAGKTLFIKITPRKNFPKGQGPLGVALSETVIQKYSFFPAVWNSAKTTFDLIISILVALWGIIVNLFAGKGVGADISGPVGIAVFTKKVAGLGLVYVLQFAAILSINLGVINILPFPALDGGRILFVAIEKMKGSPVSQKVEQSFHTVGFVLLIILLILVTFRDVTRFF